MYRVRTMSSKPSHFEFTSDGDVRLYSTSELINFPPPLWLIEPIMTMGGLTALYAPPESLKSFVAIDMALSIAAGVPWQGQATHRGFVVYISAEGGAGIGKRVKAWLMTQGLDALDVDIAWLIESIPVSADSTQMIRLMDRLSDEIQRDPILIVVDTLARCFEGDENQQEDMNNFVAGIDLLRTTYRCAVLVVHHTRLDGDRERGNTAFRGAADTMIALKRTGDIVEVSCAKQKDDAHFETFSLEKVVIPEVNSCVLKPIQALAKRAETIAMMVGILQQQGAMRWDAWVVASGLGKSEFMKHFAKIKAESLAVKDSEGFWGAKVGAENALEIEP